MAKEYPHGTQRRYVNHRCRCDECKAAHTAYYQRLRALDPEKYRAWSRKSNRKFRAAHPNADAEYGKQARQARRAIIDEIKNVPCFDCGLRYPPYVMEFDHVPERGEKAFLIGTNYRRPLEQLMVEIAKCDVVCANCHRRRTFERGQWGKNAHKVAEMGNG